MSSGAIASGLTNAEQRWRRYLARIQDRDSAALQELYDESSRVLYGLAYRMLGDRADAEEVILDVYHQVWSSADRYDASRGSVWSWLTVMTRNRAIDRLRKSNLRRTRELPIEEPVDSATGMPEPERQSMFAQEQRLVRQAMATLGKEQRQAIELAFFSGLSHSEVAEPWGRRWVQLRRGSGWAFRTYERRCRWTSGQSRTDGEANAHSGDRRTGGAVCPRRPRTGRGRRLPGPAGGGLSRCAVSALEECRTAVDGAASWRPRTSRRARSCGSGSWSGSGR